MGLGDLEDREEIKQVQRKVHVDRRKVNTDQLYYLKHANLLYVHFQDANGSGEEN